MTKSAPGDYAAHQQRRADDYILRVKAMLEEGFSTKSARKDAVGFLSSAYEILFKDAVHGMLLASRAEGSHIMPNGGNALYYSVPALHAWKAKHAAMFKRFVLQVEIANMLAGIRADVIAAPMVEKPKSKTAVKAEARNAAVTMFEYERKRS